MSVQERTIYEWLEFINIHMFNYQIRRLRSICESRGEFSGRSILRPNYSYTIYSYIYECFMNEAQCI